MAKVLDGVGVLLVAGSPPPAYSPSCVEGIAALQRVDVRDRPPSTTPSNCARPGRLELLTGRCAVAGSVHSAARRRRINGIPEWMPVIVLAGRGGNRIVGVGGVAVEQDHAREVIARAVGDHVAGRTGHQVHRLAECPTSTTPVGQGAGDDPAAADALAVSASAVAGEQARDCLLVHGSSAQPLAVGLGRQVR